MTLRKLLLIGGVTLAVAVVAVGIVAWRSLDQIVARAIEKHGSSVTGTRVSVGSVSLSARSGQGTIRRLEVANPEGFSRLGALSFGEVRVKLDTSTLRKDPIVLDELIIDAPRVRWEVDSDGHANLDAIQRASARRPPATPSDGKPARRLLIRKVTVTKGTIDADPTAMGGQSQLLALETIRLSNVGGRNGAPPDVVGQQLVTALQREIGRQVARQGLNRYVDRALKDRLGDGAGSVGDKLKSLFK